MAQSGSGPRDARADGDRPVSRDVRSAIIVGVQLPEDNEARLVEDLDELEALLSTLGVITCGRIVQRRQRLTAKCLLGTGKVDEIRELAKAREARLVVFDRPLSPPQVRNLEEMTGCEILDRAGVILEIFARHARTTQAKTQVEIARLEYMLPRLSGAWTHLHRQRGGGVVRGMGEKQIEIDRRRARERISRLKDQLQHMAEDRRVQRKARRSEIKVALVGYTNSGKTTLMNALTHAKLQAKDALFVTLDSNVRTLDPATRPKILLSDTVGFIRNLPHGLIESFKSTLDEVLEADLLLHVVDISHPGYQAQLDTTAKVLEEIGASAIPMIMVFNKIDRIDDPFLAKVLRQAWPGSIALSAYNDEDALRLRTHIYKFFETNFVRARLTIPAADQEAVSLVYNTCLVVETDYEMQGFVRIDVQATRASIERLRRFVTRETIQEKTPGDTTSGFADRPRYQPRGKRFTWK